MSLRGLWLYGVLAAIGVGFWALGQPVTPEDRVSSSCDPVQRMEDMLNQSEHHGVIEPFWQQFWSKDMPSHITPDRIHGGIGP